VPDGTNEKARVFVPGKILKSRPISELTEGALYCSTWAGSGAGLTLKYWTRLESHGHAEHSSPLLRDASGEDQISFKTLTPDRGGREGGKNNN